MKECPCCGKETYEKYSGESDGEQQLSPDVGWCSSCGFRYSQHVKHPLQEQVEDYHKKTDRRHPRLYGEAETGKEVDMTELDDYRAANKELLRKLNQAQENFATLLAEVKARDAGEKSWQDKAQKWHNEMLRCLQRAESAEQAVEDMKELLEVREAAYRKLKEEKSEGNDSGRA